MKEKVTPNQGLLVKQLIDGNEKAFRMLFDCYHNDLYKFSLSIVHSKEYAEEIVQDVFLKVWVKRQSLDPNLSFKSYLFTITRNKTFKFLKKAANNLKLRKEILYRSQKIANSVEIEMQEADLEVFMQKALRQLPPKRRLIFEMSRSEGKSYKDIGKELGISPNTVRNQMSKALETMRHLLTTNLDIL